MFAPHCKMSSKILITVNGFAIKFTNINSLYNVMSLSNMLLCIYTQLQNSPTEREISA